jgi:hypothetical protein
MSDTHLPVRGFDNGLHAPMPPLVGLRFDSPVSILAVKKALRPCQVSGSSITPMLAQRWRLYA